MTERLYYDDAYLWAFDANVTAVKNGTRPGEWKVTLDRSAFYPTSGGQPFDTGFLTFASFGKTAELNCDFIGLEEESATVDAIDSIHKEGKKALVWTVNSEESQRHFLCTKADGIITDNVSQAIILASQLETRSDVDRMVYKIKTLF